MLASELIKQLQDLIDEHGDREVYARFYDTDIVTGSFFEKGIGERKMLGCGKPQEGEDGFMLE